MSEVSELNKGITSAAVVAKGNRRRIKKIKKNKKK